MDPVTELLDDLTTRWEQAADPVRAVPMQAYMKSSMPYYGIPAGPRRALEKAAFAAHPLTDDQWRGAIRTLWETATHREQRYGAIGLARWRAHRRAATDPGMLASYRQMISTGAWWDYVDEIAQHLVGPTLAAHPEQVTAMMLAWAADEDLWIRRSAILSQNDFGPATDTDLLDAVLAANLAGSRHGTEFFIRKAIGWALRSYSYTDPDWVRSWVEDHRDQMAGLSIREAIRRL